MHAAPTHDTADTERVRILRARIDALNLEVARLLAENRWLRSEVNRGLVPPSLANDD